MKDFKYIELKDFKYIGTLFISTSSLFTILFGGEKRQPEIRLRHADSFIYNVWGNPILSKIVYRFINNSFS